MPVRGIVPPAIDYSKLTKEKIVEITKKSRQKILGLRN